MKIVDELYQERQDHIEEMGHLVRFYALPQINVDTNESYNEMKRQHDEFTEQHGVSTLHARELAATDMSGTEQALSRGVSSMSVERQVNSRGSVTPRKLSAMVKKGPYMSKGSKGDGSSQGDGAGLESRKGTTLSAFFRDNTSFNSDQSDRKPVRPAPIPTFVNVQTLTKGMVFGLTDLFCEHQPSMTLVSNGAECVSISKKLFMEHASHAFITRIREDIYPYPTEEELQANLEEQMVWDYHRREVVTHVVQDIKWSRSDKSDARFTITPALGY